MPLTEADLIEYVKNELGGGFWKVEISPQQIKAAIRDALKLYSRRIPLQGYGAMSLAPTKSKYDMSSRDMGFGIYHVSFIAPDPRPSAIFYANLLDVAPIRTSRFQDYDVFLRWRKTFMKVTSVQPEWYWDQNAKILWIYNPIEHYKASIFWYLPRTLETVELAHEQWVERYVLARSKYITGLNRSKFQGAIPGPSKDITTDGQDLKQEGKEETDKLEAELLSMQMDGPPLWD